MGRQELIDSSPLGQYGYLDKDITVMTDELEDPRLAPTQINVVSQIRLVDLCVLLRLMLACQIREIRDLIKGAQSGDRFVFLCTFSEYSF